MVIVWDAFGYIYDLDILYIHPSLVLVRLLVVVLGEMAKVCWWWVSTDDEKKTYDVSVVVCALPLLSLY